MPMTDPIADMLTRIRNASKALHPNVSIPHSRLKETIATVLKEEGYISDYTKHGEGVGSKMVVELKFYRGNPVIETINRVSKPGRRVYRNSTELPTVNNGLGIAVVSTSRGIMTAKKAKTAGVGGEVICTVS